MHIPLQAPPALVEKYRRKAATLPATADEFAAEEQIWPVDEPRRVRVRQSDPVYAAMVEAMDAEVDAKFLRQLPDGPTPWRLRSSRFPAPSSLAWRPSDDDGRRSCRIEPPMAEGHVRSGVRRRLEQAATPTRPIE